MEFQVDGKTVYAATGGRPFVAGQPTVAFLHGAGADHTVWALQTRYFAHRGRNVLALDLPGHGRSDGPALETVEAMADWVVAVLDAVGVDEAALIGHSMGSLVALDAAKRHGARVAALALLGAALPMPVAEPLLAAAEADHHAAFDMITIWGHSRPAQIGGNTAPGLWMTGEGLRLLERSGPGVLHAGLKACNAYADGLDCLESVACPALLVLGASDAMTPAASARAIAGTLPDARVVTLEGCGHMMMTEKPDQVLDALISIL